MAVSLHKAYKGDVEYLIYITDHKLHYMDYMRSTLTNKAIFEHIMPNAFRLGYTDFMVGISTMTMGTPKDVDILDYEPEMDVFTINWDVVRVVDKEEWTATK